MQHPHLRQGPPTGRPVQRSHLRPRAAGRASSATSPPTPGATGRATGAAFPPMPKGQRQGDRCSIPTYAQERSIGPGKQGIPPPLGTHYATSPPADGQVSSARIPGPVACRQGTCQRPLWRVVFPKICPPVGHPCSIPTGARDPWFCFACGTAGRASSAASPPTSAMRHAAHIGR